MAERTGKGNAILILGIVLGVVLFGLIYTSIRTNSMSSDTFEAAPIVESYNNLVTFDSL